MINVKLKQSQWKTIGSALNVHWMRFLYRDLDDHEAASGSENTPQGGPRRVPRVQLGVSKDYLGKSGPEFTTINASPADS